MTTKRRDPVGRLIHIPASEGIYRPGYVLKPGLDPPDPEKPETSKVIWHVEESNLKISMAGPLAWSSDNETVALVNDTHRQMCGTVPCDNETYRTLVTLNVSGLEDLSGTYAYSLFDRFTFTTFPVADYQLIIANGDACELFALQKLIVGWTIPGVDVYMTASASVWQTNVGGFCGSANSTDTAAVSTKAFLILDVETVPIGMPKFDVLGIYVRNWIYTKITNNVPGVAAAITFEYGPAWIGNFPGSLLGGTLGAGANRLTAPQAAFFEAMIIDEKTHHRPVSGGGEGLACLDTGGTVNRDLYPPLRRWSAFKTPLGFPLTGIHAVECCKPATCEIDLSLPNADAYEDLATCELPPAPSFRMAVIEPVYSVVLETDKFIWIVDGVAHVRIMVTHMGGCNTEVKGEDRIPDGLGTPYDITNNRGTTDLRDIAPRIIRFVFEYFGDGRFDKRRMCYDEIMTIEYKAEVLDIDDILDWMQITYQEFPVPPVMFNNLPEDPDPRPACRESDEAYAKLLPNPITGEIATSRTGNDIVCAAECLPADDTCEYIPCLVMDTTLYELVPMKDGRAYGCCLSVVAFQDPGGIPEVCNVTYFFDRGSLCYVPLFYSKVCSSTLIRLDARTYLKFKAWAGT